MIYFITFSERNACAGTVARAHCTLLRVHHHDKWHFARYIVVKQGDDMWMIQAGNDLSLIAKEFNLWRVESEEKLDRGLALQMNMCAKIDLAKSSCAQVSDQAIIAQLVPREI